MRSVILLLSASLLTFHTVRANPVSRKEKAPGVWQLTVGKPEKVNLLSELKLTPKTEALQGMGAADIPFDTEQIQFTVIDGKTYIRFPLTKDEKIFGLGLNFKTVEQRGRIMRLHVDHYGGSDNGRTHAPVPFFVSSRGYGALINTARYVDVWCGTSVSKDSPNPPVVRDRNSDPAWAAQPYSDNLEILVPADGVEVLLFAGPEMIDVVRRYNLYNGGGCLPPRWGLGFWHRTPSLFSGKEVLAEADEFEKRGFPLSVIGLEPGWMSRAYPCTYEWDTVRFPQPKAFTDTLAARNIRTNVWINPYVSPDGELYDKILPYAGSHTVWCGVVPDYRMPKVQKLIGDHFARHMIDKGISGYKMDENDGFDSWLWPDVARFPSGTPAEQMRQLYGSLMQKTTAQTFRDRDQRTYGLVRAGNAGTSSYPYVIYNDYYNHRDFITAQITSSFIGVLWTPEVRASGNAEEWLRRMQTVCFSPLAMLNAWADGTKPWSFPEVSDEVNRVALLRMQLIPYLYTAFADYAFYGTPPVRAMNLEPGFTALTTEEKGVLDATANPYAMAVKREIKDQFMVGDNLLVAPFFTGDTARRVVLPAGKWYDFYTGQLAGEGEVIFVRATMDKIPVYVRDGGIIPLWPPITRITNEKQPIEIRHYGNKAGSYALYDDDGETFGYERGEYTRIAIEVDVDGAGRKSGRVVIPEGAAVWSFGDATFRYMTNASGEAKEGPLMD